MNNKFHVIFFILVQVVVLALCDQEADSDSFNSFGPQTNENAHPEDIDLSQEKDLYMYQPNEGTPDAKNMRNRPLFNERFLDSPDAKPFENSQNLGNNFSEQRNMPQFNPQNGFHNAFDNWQQEKRRPLYPNEQEIQERNNPVQTFNGRHANNQWGRNGNIFQNSQQQQNMRQYQDVKAVDNYNGRTLSAGKANAYDDRNDDYIASSWSYNPGMSQFQQQPQAPMPQKKVSLTLLNEEKTVDNYRQNSYNNQYNSQINSNFNRNVDGFRNPNQEKGIVINFNSDCPASKTCPDPVFHKFIYPHKPHVPRAHIPSFQIPQIPRISQSPQISQISQIPETPIYTRQMSTPIYCL